MWNVCGELQPTEEHLEHCEVCRGLVATHSELLKLSAELPSAKLSEDFNARLLDQVQQTRTRKPVRLLDWLLKSYWALATVGSLLLLFRVTLPNGLDKSWVVVLTTMAIGSFALLGFLPARFVTSVSFRLRPYPPERPAVRFPRSSGPRA